jgi:hypothetical protein
MAEVKRIYRGIARLPRLSSLTDEWLLALAAQIIRPIRPVGLLPVGFSAFGHS